MDYKKIYDALVEKAKVRGLDKSKHEGYFEIHHIIPVCLGGSDEDSNLVMLTAREHILAHVFLWKAYPDHAGLTHAAQMMALTREYGKLLPTKVLASLREDSSAKRSLRKEGAGHGETRHINLSGKRFGRLVVQESYTWHTFPNGQRKAKWDCICDCGSIKQVMVGALQSGYTQSCGCYQREQTSKARKKWDFSKDTYAAYHNMLTRCYKEGHKSNENFRKYGIEVCSEWMGDEGIVTFVQDMGEKPEGLQLIRLDPMSDFSKENCRWVTKSEASKTMYKFPRSKLPLTGKVGVKFDKRRNVYVAKMDIEGKYLTKQFKTFEEAANQRDYWESIYKISA